MERMFLQFLLMSVDAKSNRDIENTCPTDYRTIERVNSGGGEKLAWWEGLEFTQFSKPESL